MRKFIILTITALMLLSSIAVNAEGFTSYIANTQENAPEYTPAVVAGMNANDPNAYSRYQGLPNPYAAGEWLAGTTFSYHKRAEGDYCTKITTTETYYHPYMQHVDSDRTFGKMRISFDAMRDATSGSIEAAFLLRKADNSGNKAVTASLVSSSGKLNTKVTNDENYKLFETIKVNEWHTFDIILDLDAETTSLSIDGFEIYKDVSTDSLAGVDVGAYYCFRITHNKRGDGNAYIDNVYIRHDVNFNGELLKASSMSKIDSPIAMSRRIPILVNRYDLNVFPHKDGNTLYMPLRFATDSMHGAIAYNPETADITVTRGGRTSVLNTGKNNYTIDGEIKTLSAPLKLVSGTTYIPAKDVAEILYTNVYYNNNNYVMMTDYNNVPETELITLGEHMEREAE